MNSNSPDNFLLKFFVSNLIFIYCVFYAVIKGVFFTHIEKTASFPFSWRCNKISFIFLGKLFTRSLNDNLRYHGLAQLQTIA